MLIALPLAPLVVEGGALIALGFVGSAVYIAEELWGFRRAELPPITGAEKETTHKQMVQDVIAGAKVPVASLPTPQPWQFGPTWLPASKAKETDWGLNNTKTQSNSGVGTISIINSNSLPVDLYYEVEWEPWGGPEVLPNGYLDSSVDNSAGYAPLFPQGPHNRSGKITNVQPGTTPFAAEFVSQYFNFGTYQKWGYWLFDIPGANNTQVDIFTKDNNTQIQVVILYGDANISFDLAEPEATPKPNQLEPQSFKEDETPKRIAPPLPSRPSTAPDIGTPVTPGKNPATPGTTPATPRDPTRKEDPKAPPNLQPATVPIWQPGVLPATTPSPATVPAPLRNPQTIPNTNPARPNVQFDVAAKPLPQAATAVKPTPTTTHKVGPITIPAKAPAATLQGIAEEVGRIEQKLEIVLNPGPIAESIDWMKRAQDIWEFLQSVTAGGEYELSSPCELDANGQRIVKTAPFSGSINYMVVLENKIDALAELMQHSKDLKQPACMPTTQPSTVTVTAYELPPYS